MDTIDALFISEINRVLTTFPSIYSNNDVVSLLENLKLTVLDEVAKLNTTSGITEEQFQVFNSNVRHRLERSLNNDSHELVDHSSAEFSIDYGNQLSIDHIDVNVDFITEELDEILLAEFEESFGFLTTKTEE